MGAGTEDRSGAVAGDRPRGAAAPSSRIADESPRRSGAVEERASSPAARRYEEFGGVNTGSALFGWLVAMGLATLLIAIVGAAGTAIGLTSLKASDARSNAGTLGIVGGALLLAILLLAYYAGGYVAGRMSRFDGARQGFAVWLWGLAVTLILAAAGAIFGSQYNVLARLNLPRIPVDEGSLATGGAIALASIVLGTLLSAALGGRVGQRYHRRVDRAGYDDRSTAGQRSN